MDKNLVKMATMWEDNGMPAVLKMAPKGAVTFDRMLVVFGDESMRFIRKVFFYDSRKDKFTAEY
jgi:Asp-tRNA(Asn)/Glu-tRNA(Gln) amidotransferase B subunit